MHLTPVYLGVILTASVLLLKASEAWWFSGSKDRFAERTAELWLSLAETKRHTQTASFLKAIGTLLDRLYGQSTFSARAFWRTLVTSTVFYVIALAVIGLRSGVPFSMEHPPWEGYDFSFKFLEQMESISQKQADAAKDEKTRKTNLDTKALIRRWLDVLERYKTSQFRIVHTALSLGLAIFVSGAGAFLGLALSRNLLRDLAALGTLSGAWALIAAEVCLFCIFYASSLVILTVISIPITLGGLIGIFVTFWLVSYLAAAVFLLAAVILLAAYAPLWIRVAAMITPLPLAIVTIAGVGVIALRWLGWPAQRVAVRLLDSALKSEKGPATYFTSMIILLASLLGLLLTS